MSSLTNELDRRPAAVDRFFPKAAGILAALVGVWLFVAPLLLDIGQPTRLNQMLAGAVAVLVGGMLLLRMVGARVLGGVLGLLGGWLIVAPLVMPIGRLGSWNEIASGAFLIVLGLVATVPSAEPGRGRSA